MWRLYLGVWNLWPLQCWWKNANNWRCDKKCFTTLARWDLHIWHSTQSEKTGIYLCTLMSPLLRSASGVYWPQHVAVWWRRRGVMNDSPWYFRGTFCSTRNSENFETGTNCMEISCKSFQKIWKWLNFWKANHSFESSRKSGRKSIGNKISVYLTRLSSFQGNLKWLMHSPQEISGNSNQIFHQMESAPGCQFGYPWTNHLSM